MRTLSWSERLKDVWCFIAVLCSAPHCCDSRGVLTNRADLTTIQLERSPAESQGTFSGGSSLFLKISRIMRERDSKSCKVIFEVSNGLDPSKSKKKKSKGDHCQVSWMGVFNLLHLRTALFCFNSTEDAKQTFSPLCLVSHACVLVSGLCHGKVEAGEWRPKQALRTEPFLYLHSCSD